METTSKWLAAWAITAYKHHVFVERYRWKLFCFTKITQAMPHQPFFTVRTLSLLFGVLTTIYSFYWEFLKQCECSLFFVGIKVPNLHFCKLDASWTHSSWIIKFEFSLVKKNLFLHKNSNNSIADEFNTEQWSYSFQLNSAEFIFMHQLTIFWVSIFSLFFLN